MVGLAAPRGSAGRVAAAGLLLGSLLSAPLAVQAQTVRMVAPGVLCDSMALRGSGACYDQNGVSLPQTGRHLGSRAEARLRAYLDTNPAPREFRLSNGTVCSVPERKCWQDGWTKGNVAEKLSRELFNASSSGSGSGGSGSTGTGTNGERPPSTRETGLCSLSRAGRPLFDGPCDLRQMSRGEGIKRYTVRLNNGTSYQFTNRGGTFTIADEFGSTWPVTHVNHGVTGIFRWADMTLVATQTMGRETTPTAGPTSSDDLGRALGNLLNTLFR